MCSGFEVGAQLPAQQLRQQLRQQRLTHGDEGAGAGFAG